VKNWTRVIKSKFSEKYQRSALKTLLIAKDKDDDIKKILKYDITTYSYLYDRDFITKPDKYQIVDELKELVRSQVVPEKDEDGASMMTFGKFIEEVFYRMITA